MTASRRHRRRLATLGTLVAVATAGCVSVDTTNDPTATPTSTQTASEDDTPDVEGALTVYSGRNEELVGQVFEDFTATTGIEVDVRYGDTAELAVTILQEGDASPADVYFGQDAGALGALEAEGRFAPIDPTILEVVDPAYRSVEGNWVGVTGRVRVVAYSTDRVDEDELPASILDITDPVYAGRVGYAPTNGSFQSFVTALRVTEGEEAARDWLESLLSNEPVAFENNSSQLEAIARGEIDFALVNHYYLYRFLAEDPDFPVDNHYLPGDIGGLVNVAGVGVLDGTDQPDAAAQLVAYLLGQEAQDYFGQTAVAREFPLRTGTTTADLPGLETLQPPDVDLSRLEDLQGTLALLQEVGALE